MNAARQQDVRLPGLSVVAAPGLWLLPDVGVPARSRLVGAAAGGIIRDDDAVGPKQAGIAIEFRPGASLYTKAMLIRASVKQVL